MKINAVPSIEKRGEADIIFLPFWKGKEKPKNGSLNDKVAKWVERPILSGDFTGKEGELALVYLKDEKEKRALLVGLGEEEKISVNVLRKCYGKALRFAQEKKLSRINVLFPALSQLRGITADECLQGVVEGLLLTNYHFAVKSAKEDMRVLIKEIELVGILPKVMTAVKRYEAIAESVYFARDLVNGNADLITPAFLAEEAKTLAKRFPVIKTVVFDRARIEKEKMGLFLAVAKGSSYDPAFIMMRYEGDPRHKEHVAVIGKGLTFDTGGLNLKPTGSMETMRDDMSGAAVVMGLMTAIAQLGLKVNVTGIIAACENAIDANSAKPGDVYTSYSGKTVEITNTDAEGRLTLADAISYCVKNVRPTMIIDLATLTGSVVIALGEDIAGLFSNNDALAHKLMEASKVSGELLHRLPLHKPYFEGMKSDIADLKNAESGRAAGSIKAALFLEDFVEKKPWAHIDIAGTAFSSKEGSYTPKNGVGFGIRLLLEFLNTLSRN